METVEVANKELKVETRLRNIETRWKEEQLGFVRHRDTEVTLSTRREAAFKAFFLNRSEPFAKAATL